MHVFPGVVRTGVLTSAFWPWLKWVLDHTVVAAMSPFMVPLQEVGERTVFHATSARYPPRKVAGGKSAGVPLPAGLEVAKGAGGGLGAYLLHWTGEEGEGKVMPKYRQEGMRERVWDHTMQLFERITGKS